VTIGYKGRLLVDLEARRRMTHSAGPEATAGTAAVALWNRVEAYRAKWNAGREKAFDQLLPSLREIHTDSDGLEERAIAKIGLRLPLDFDPAPLQAEVEDWARSWVAGQPTHGFATPRSDVGAELVCAPRAEETERRDVFSSAATLQPGGAVETRAQGPAGEIRLVYRAFEPAWRGDSRNALVRSFLAAIRAQGEADAKPSFVVKTGTSDMNVVAPVWRCPILAYGPGDSRLDHTPDEHVELDEFWRAVLVLERALHSLAEELWRRG
jgi:LysW-gamma-L-lysine carboxypeptidase